jgi:hypothetical protein
MGASVDIDVVEYSRIYEGGGGFERVLWFILIDQASKDNPCLEDRWLHPRELLKHPLAGFAASLDASGAPVDDEDQSTPAGYWWRRAFVVSVPVGTRVRRRHSMPDRLRTSRDPTLRSMLYRHVDTIFTVQADGGLLSEHVARERARSARVEAPPTSPAEAVERLTTLLAQLESGK